MEYLLKNDYLSVSISDFGAEIRKIIDKDGDNRLNKGEEKYWSGVSPILFPFVSGLLNNTYKVDGKDYKIEKHGFLRNSILNVEEKGTDFITFALKYNAETLKKYPYKFLFKITYTLIKNQVISKIIVENLDDKNMYFMIGGHPAFMCPLYENENFEDYYLQFEKKETTNTILVLNGFISNQEKLYLNKENVINLNHDLFINDAIILNNLKSSYVDLKSKNHKKFVRFYYSDFDYLAIWSKTQKDTPFVCLEPWSGIKKNNEIELNKMNTLVIKEKMNYCISYIMEFH